jgi:hypothetical protein
VCRAGRTVGAFTVRAGTLASRRSAGQPVDVVLGDGADAEESVSAAARGGVEAAAERTGTIIVHAGGRSSGISSATSSRASSLDRWKNRGSTSVRFSGVRTFAISKMVSRAPETREDAMPREIGPAACADGRSAERAAAERCVRSLLARWPRAKRARAETASSDPLGSLQRDCSGSLDSKRAVPSSPTHGLLASRSALRRVPARGTVPATPPSLPFRSGRPSRPAPRSEPVARSSRS